jgi:hypothetical protein
MFLFLLPFLGSGFVPTDSMPAGLRWFADNQPFTAITDTLRSLLGDQHVGGGDRGRRLVPGHHRRRLPLGGLPLQPPPRPLIR